MCFLCKVRQSRNHLSTKRHQRALHPIVKAGRPERIRRVRDWADEERARDFDLLLAAGFEPEPDFHTYVEA